MAATVDDDVFAGLRALTATAGQAAPVAVGDIATRRRNSRHLFEHVTALRTPVDGVEVSTYALTTDDGHTLSLDWYRCTDAQQPGGAVLYLHGGGMTMTLNVFQGLYESLVRGYVADSGVPMLMVDYRVAPEHPYPVPVEDCFNALQWLAGHAADLDVDPRRIAVMGDSAGGGLTAAVCLLARDRGGPHIAQQLLIYPMLDDRTPQPDPHLQRFSTWTYGDDRTGWRALLGDTAGTDEVPGYAAPARAEDLGGLPDTYLDVGALDILRDQNIEYIRRLAAAGVATELHVHPGCPHAFDTLAPNADVSQRVIADRVRRLRSL